MAQGLWLLVEWVDERNVFSNYGVVNVSSLIGDDNELHTGKIVLARDRHTGIARRGQVLRISDTKRYVKEMKVMLERQDNQVKNVLSLCMNTIKEMKTRTMFSPQINQSGHLLQGRDEEIDSTDSETDQEINPELNFTQSSIKFVPQPIRPESFMNNQLIRTLHEKSLHNRRSLASSTPLPPKPEVTKLMFDQATQTDADVPPKEKIEELEAVIQTLYRQFLNLTSNLENIDIQSMSNGRVSEERLSEIENIPELREEVNETQNTSCEKQEDFKRNIKGIIVRRASAQTTNTTCVEMAPAENTVDMVSIGSGNVVVPARLLEEIDWTSYTSATRQLLQAVFPRRVLATHSMTGKQSPAFADKPAKKCLDPAMVDDIVNMVSERCGVSKRIVRSCITTKCTDEAKLYRNRQMFKKIRQQQNQENVPPSRSPGSLNECSNTRE